MASHSKKRQVVAALLTGLNAKQAAAHCNLGERTVYRWLAEDADFQAELAGAEGRAIDAATRRLVGLQSLAIAAFRDALTDPEVSDGVRIRAAENVLNYLLKLRELRNIETRLTRLEENL